MCDRSLVRSAVTKWFGSEDNFEDFVREVLPSAVVGIASGRLLEYRCLVLGTLPMLWFKLDVAAAAWFSNCCPAHWSTAPLDVVDGFFWWLAGGPLVLTF